MGIDHFLITLGTAAVSGPGPAASHRLRSADPRLVVLGGILVVAGTLAGVIANVAVILLSLNGIREWKRMGTIGSGVDSDGKRVVWSSKEWVLVAVLRLPDRPRSIESVESNISPEGREDQGDVQHGYK